MNYSYIPDPRLLSVKRVTDLTEILHDTPENSENLDNSYILIASNKLDETTGLRSYKVKVSVFTEILKEYSNNSIVSNEEKLENFLQSFDITTSYENLLDISKNFYSDENGYTYMFVIDPVMAYTYLGEDGKYHLSDGILTYTAVEEYVSNTASNLTPDDSSIVVGNKTYKLKIENGVIGFTSTTDYYSAITLTLQNTNANENFEYNSPSGSLTLKARSSKAGTITTSNWNGINVNTHYNSATEFESKNNQYVKNTPKTFTLSIKEDPEGTHTQQTATVNVNVKFENYKVFVFCSTTDINNISISSNSDNQPIIGSFTGNYKLYSTSINESPVASFNVNTNESYIYFLLPTSLVSSAKSIYWTGSESMGDTPGNARKTNLTLYGNKGYTLFKSEGKYSSGTSINLKYK